MKKIMNKINFAIIAIMVHVPFVAEAANTAAKTTKKINIEKDLKGTSSGICDMLANLHSVFNILRIMAFIGAAFYIAGWAWGYISSGKAEVKDVKEKGIGLLIGFSALLLVGVVLSFIMSASGLEIIGCPEGARLSDF